MIKVSQVFDLRCYNILPSEIGGHCRLHRAEESSWPFNKYHYVYIYKWVSLVTCVKCESCDLAPTLVPIVRRRELVILDARCMLGNNINSRFVFLAVARLATRLRSQHSPRRVRLGEMGGFMTASTIDLAIVSVWRSIHVCPVNKRNPFLLACVTALHPRRIFLLSLYLQ